MVPKLYGFWSYSREGTSGIAALHREMQASLSGNGPGPGDAEIFFDTNPVTGIGSGQDWGRRTVEAASRSALFFWVQNPRWPTRPVCRFEFDMFEDRVGRIAREFSTSTHPLDQRELWHSLVVPIRWAAITEAHWDTIEETATADRLRRLWEATNVLAALNFAEKDNHATSAGDDYSQLCRLVTAHISKRLVNAIPSLGGNVTRLLEYLAADQGEFVARWLDEFERRDILRLERQGIARPPRATSHSTAAWRQRQLNWPNLRQVEIPSIDGQPSFWVTGEPVSEKLLDSLDTISLVWRIDPAGNTLWPASTAGWFVDELALVHLALPTTAQSRILLDLQARGRDALNQLGVYFRVSNFWHSQEPHGRIAPAEATSETYLPLLLVSNHE